MTSKNYEIVLVQLFSDEIRTLYDYKMKRKESRQPAEKRNVEKFRGKRKLEKIV